jgi:hypothetical protein
MKIYLLPSQASGKKFFLRALAILLLTSAACKKSSPEKNNTGTPNSPVTPITPTPGPTSLVYLGSDGKLVYNTFLNEGETQSSEKINTIPDFSNCGYKGGGVPIPNADVKITLAPQAGDNLARIQQAIDEIEALSPDATGMRGALLLQAGTYDVNGTLVIEKDGVVLRGQGQGLTGTIIKATKTASHTLIQVKGTGSGIAENSATKQLISTTYVPNLCAYRDKVI